MLISSTCDAGSENKNTDDIITLGNESFADVKKSEYSRKTKDRFAPQNNASVFSASSIEESHDSWPVASLYCEYSNVRINDDMNESDPMIATYDCDNEYTNMGSKENILSWATSILSQSPTARCLVKEASKEGWKLSLENLNGPDFHLDVPEKKIILDNGDLSEYALARSAYFSSIVLVSLIRALRDVWQEKRNGAFDEDFTPESILTLERVRAADLDVIAILVAWELRCEGYNNLWRHILGSDDSDLAMRFSGYLERDPTSHFTHKALAATFTQWFRSEDRVSACDHETLDYMDEVLTMSDIQNPFGKGSVNKIDIERLSCLPDRTAYLQGQADSIISDPLYAGMNDEINQSHFMHIVYDTRVIYVQNVPFRNFDLAERIFPNGMMTPDTGATEEIRR